MKITSRVFLVCASFLFASSLVAQSSGPASNGDFQFGLSGTSGSVQYDARLQGSGAGGQITFTAAADISNEDVDGAGTGATAVSNVTLHVNVNCLQINGNRAAMSGTITSSSVPAYVGMRAVLAVEDNGEGHNATLDRFTWGVYGTTTPTWVPVDAEVPDDNGAMLSWFASDAERFDDVPIPSNQSMVVDCKTFPFGSYAFESVQHGDGNIQVKP